MHVILIVIIIGIVTHFQLSTAQKMRANGTVVTEILHFKYIMLNTGFGLSCYIKNKAYPDSQILKIIHICYKYKYLLTSNRLSIKEQRAKKATKPK